MHPARRLRRWLRQIRRQPERDRDLLDELAWRAPTRGGWPAGLEFEWLGVSGFRLAYQQHQLLVDPYLSRLSLRQLLRRPLLPDTAALGPLIARTAPGGSSAPLQTAVLIGHCHFDHALDAPALARTLGCRVYGSRSLARLMHLHRLGHLAVTVAPYQRHELGPFCFEFLPSRHARLLAGLGVPFAGELDCESLDALTAPRYRCGAVWAIRIEVAGQSFHHHGSADLIDEALPARPVDHLLLCIAGRQMSHRFLERIVRRTRPALIVPHHHDDFLRPLAQPVPLMPGIALGRFVEEVERVSRDLAIEFPCPATALASPAHRRRAAPR
jgi:L-ascorbate metabolism protein UlaG (beta-lactamase superfamily)